MSPYERWSPLEGWVPDPRRPGYLRHPDHHPDARRDAAGHWYSVQSIERAKAAVEEAAKAVQGHLPTTPQDQAANDAELIRRVRQAAREVLGRD